MLFFRQSGRLGNQIFQYAALKTYSKKKETLVLWDFYDLEQVFDGVDAITCNLNNSRIERFLFRKIYEFLEWLSSRKFISQVVEDKTSDEVPLVLNDPGWLSRLKLVEKSYFQYESSFSSQSISSLSLKLDLVRHAEKFLRIHAGNRPCVFVHVRRGDYQTWPSKENPAVLPLEYYHRCIDELSSKFSNPIFIFTSDDPSYVKSNFNSVENLVISTNSAFEDFAIMAQCVGGVLSASSFSWWAAYFAKQSHSDTYFLAPKYWAGHSLKSWYPKFIETSFLRYVDVSLAVAEV